MANRDESKHTLPEADVLKNLSFRLGKDASNYAPAVLIPAALNLIGIIIFTRLFLPEVYGDYVLVIASVNILCIMFSDWLVHSLLRFVPQFRKTHQLGILYKNAFSILAFELLSLLLFSLIIFSLFKNFLGRFSSYYFLGIWMLLAFILFKVTTSIFQANLLSSKYAKYHVLFSFLRFLFSIGFVFLISRNISWLIAASALSYTVFLWPVTKEIKTGPPSPPGEKCYDFSLLKKLCLYGFPLIGWVLATEILMFSDKFMLALLRNSTEVGIYGANFSLTSAGIGLISFPITMAAHPIILSAWETHDRNQIQNVIMAFSRYFLMLIFPCFALILVLSQQLVAIFLGPSFHEGYVILPMIFCGFSLWSFAMFGHKYLELLEKTKLMFFLVMICAAVNIGLNLILIPRSGYMGAAIASLVSMGLYPVTIYFSSRKTIQLKWKIPWLSLLRIGCSSLVMLFLMIELKKIIAGWETILIILVCGLSGLVAYLALIFITKEIKGFEIQYLKKLIKGK